MSDKDLMLSENGLAEFLKVNNKRIHRLIVENDIKPDGKSGRWDAWSLKAFIPLFTQQVTDRAKEDGIRQGRGLPDGDETAEEDTYAFQKWRETKARADKIELQNQVELQLLAPLEAVIQRDRIVANAMATTFESLPIKIKHAAPDISESIVEVINDITAKCRNELDQLIDERIKQLEEQTTK